MCKAWNATSESTSSRFITICNELELIVDVDAKLVPAIINVPIIAVAVVAITVVSCHLVAITTRG
jgi:hypothetical protein